MNIVFSLMGKTASRVAEILGFWPKEKEVHYITDAKKETDIRMLIQKL